MKTTLFGGTAQKDEALGGSVGGEVLEKRQSAEDGPALVDLRIKLKPKDALQVMIQMRAMLNAGVPLLAAMRTLIEHATTPESEKVLRKITSVVESGHDLSYAFDCLPNCFEKYVVHLLAAGEQAGALDESLGRSIELLTNQIELGGKIKAALTYPGFLMFMTFTMTLGILYFLVPKFEGLMMKRPDELPWTTKLVLSASQTLHAAPELVFGGIILVIFAFLFALKSKKSRAVIFDAVSKMPVIGDLIFKAYLSRSVGTLALTLESGVPILTGLEHARQVSELPRLQAQWEKTAAVVRDGRPMHTALCGKEMPPALTQMIVAGESSGSLDSSLRKAAEFLDAETQAALTAFTALLGPATVVVAGALVGFIVVSLMTPILTMAKYVG
ncbi:MAG TPA: type II secretion system F family protein [Planctomycetes bacterium]|jgi:type IV pilus assembly protein PilC|nr:type II secretion system F family protein [Planctomycetota bacterium]